MWPKNHLWVYREYILGYLKIENTVKRPTRMLHIMLVRANVVLSQAHLGNTTDNCIYIILDNNRRIP